MAHECARVCCLSLVGCLPAQQIKLHWLVPVSDGQPSSGSSEVGPCPATGVGTRDLLRPSSAGSCGSSSSSSKVDVYNLQLYAGSWGTTSVRTNSRVRGRGSNPASVKPIWLRTQWDGDRDSTELSWDPSLAVQLHLSALLSPSEAWGHLFSHYKIFSPGSILNYC